MTAEINALVCMLVGLALFILALIAPKVAWIMPLALICFAVGLFHWLPGHHAASVK